MRPASCGLATMESGNGIMEYYVALDVSLEQTSICLVDQAGSGRAGGRLPSLQSRSPALAISTSTKMNVVILMTSSVAFDCCLKSWRFVLGRRPEKSAV
jgi:hypothetical protein